jgi:hypothetical protein
MSILIWTTLKINGQLCEIFEIQTEMLDEMLDDFFRELEREIKEETYMKRRTCQLAVDTAHWMIQDAVESSCRKVLGMYRPKVGIKLDPSHAEALIDKESDIVAAQQYYKMKHRGGKVTIVGTEGKEAMETLETIFAETFHKDEQDIDPDEMISISKFDNVSQKLTKSCILEYPRYKAPGPDGIDEQVYKILIDGTKLQLHLKGCTVSSS